MSDREILIIKAGMRGRDSVAAPVDYATMQSDVAEVKARANITGMDAIPDVNAPSPADGHVLVYNDTTDTWESVPGPVPLAVTTFGNPVADNVGIIDTIYGLQTTTDFVFGRNRALISVIFAGTGTANAVARSDHFHNLGTNFPVTFGPTGYLSSGARTLASTSVTLISGVGYIVEAELKPQMRGADTGACYYMMTVNIGGNARTSTGGTNGFWCVQGVPNKESWVHAVPITGTGSAVTITGSVSYFGGGGFYPDGGEMRIRLIPDR